MHFGAFREVHTKGDTHEAGFPPTVLPLRIGGAKLRNRIVFAGHGSRFVDWHTFHLNDRRRII